MAVGRVLGARLRTRSAWWAGALAAAALVGCGGADQTDGSQAEADAAATQRQDDMRKFYASKTQPKSKTKKQP